MRSTRGKSGARRKGGPPPRHAPKKTGAQGQEAPPQVRVERLPMERPAGGRKLTRATMEALLKDPVGRRVHEIELENEERRKQGLPPLSYGQYEAKYRI